MWSEKVKTGYKFVERYRDPLTGKSKKKTVILDRDTTQSRKVAQRALDAKIQAAIRSSMSAPAAEITLEELADQYIADQKLTRKDATSRRNYFYTKKSLSLYGKDTLASAINANYIRTKLVALDASPDSRCAEKVGCGSERAGDPCVDDIRPEQPC